MKANDGTTDVFSFSFKFIKSQTEKKRIFWRRNAIYKVFKEKNSDY